MPATKTVLIIAGPTAVGKTGIAISVAQALSTSIISADSRQCYQGLIIGTAQPSADQLAAVPHYFINEFPVSRALNAADFEQLALGYLDKIFQTHDTAVVCGGTGLYIRALCEGLDEMPPIDETINSQVNADFEKHGLVWLRQQVQSLDPVLFDRIDNQNPARLLRALSFRLSTGQSLLDFQSQQKKERPFRIIKAALELPRDLL
jgi:tRNA dimethylallyltransferase